MSRFCQPATKCPPTITHSGLFFPSLRSARFNEKDMEPHRIGPIQSVQEFMEKIRNEPRTSDTVKRIFRGQADEWDLLPRLFRADREPQEFEVLEEKLLTEFKARSPYLLPSTPSEPLDWLSWPSTMVCRPAFLIGAVIHSWRYFFLSKLQRPRSPPYGSTTQLRANSMTARISEMSED
jgi:hypothetical protein